MTHERSLQWQKFFHIPNIEAYRTVKNVQETGVYFLRADLKLSNT